MTEQAVEPLDLIWGTKAIAIAIGRSVRQTEGMLYKRELPAKKLNGRWVISRRQLVALIEGRAA